ncbi:BgtE-4526 [Blumeria graminis f. sp. tritici]|uniref:BgtE-4526 n=1 Tax=Blumeria graminis f. sp. tritici TaxID=62690 RepID=A0A9X9L8Q3_BLUGR|nr:BgtE-4526 [Blumeria graminis f. sp. tritici]
MLRLMKMERPSAFQSPSKLMMILFKTIVRCMVVASASLDHLKNPSGVRSYRGSSGFDAMNSAGRSILIVCMIYQELIAVQAGSNCLRKIT